MKFDHVARCVAKLHCGFQFGRNFRIAENYRPRRQSASTESTNRDDGSSAKLTTRFDNFPAWFPKGDLMVFSRFSEDDYDIYTIRPDGTGLRTLPLHGEMMHTLYGLQMDSIFFSAAPVSDSKMRHRSTTAFPSLMVNFL
jgi:hypothetical protein